MAELDLLAPILDIVAEQGSTIRIPIAYRDEAEELVPLLTFTARMQLKVQAGDDEPVHESNTENGGITLDDDDPNIYLYLSPTESAAIEAGSYKYDFELIDSAGEVDKLFKGKFKLKAEITVEVA